MIEPDYGLLDELLSRDVVTNEQYSLIRCGTTVSQRNGQLLQYMTQNDAKSSTLMHVLQLTDQQHVVNFIQHHAGKQAESITTYVVLNSRKQKNCHTNGKLLKLLQSCRF